METGMEYCDLVTLIFILPRQLSDADFAELLQKETQKLQEMRAERQTAAACE